MSRPMLTGLDLLIQSAPSAPSAGSVRLYAGTDKALHALDADGSEGAGGATGPTITRVSSQQDITTAGFVDITNLSFAVTAGQVYRFEAFVAYRSSATGTGAIFAYNAPAMTRQTILSTKQILTGGTASTDMMSTAILTAVDTPLPNSVAEPQQAIDLVWKIEGILLPSASGTFVLRMSKENVAGTISVMPGSWIESQVIT